MNKILKSIFILTLILLIISLNFELLALNFEFYKKEFSKFNVYEKIPDADKHALNLINYFKDKEELSNFFNEKEKLHLKDVKNLFKKIFLIFYISLILTISLLIYFIYKKYYKTIWSSFFISTLILIIIILLFFIIDFNYLFTKFHIIMFNNYLWQLNPNEDNLINLFPEKLQYDIIRKIFINILISNILLLSLALIIKFKIKQKVFK